MFAHSGSFRSGDEEASHDVGSKAQSELRRAAISKTSSTLAAVAPQLNSRTRWCPLSTICERKSRSWINFEIAASISSTFMGSTSSAASPATSASDEDREVTTGVP